MNINQKATNLQRMVDCYFDMNLNNVCRVCLEKNQSCKKMFSIFDNNRPPYSVMIMACASVQVLDGDGLPSMICNKCVGLLNVAWQFKQLCESSDAKLRRYFSNAQISSDLDVFSIGIKEEHNFFPLAQELPQMLPSLQHNETIMQTEPEVTDNDLIIDECEQRTINSSKKQTPPDDKDEKTKERKKHQCDLCGRTFQRREYLTQHIRIHTGERPYKCHLCEKNFINSGHLTTHMRTHTGERPHKCGLCPKAFSTRQELNKHTMVHSGDRPFVCKLCGKRFGSSSNLYSHLKHHTGEKNFTCETCGKAFYTKQELKQHFVVHTGEKAYLCEFCNKRFSQIAHLRRHSKLHK